MSMSLHEHLEQVTRADARITAIEGMVDEYRADPAVLGDILGSGEAKPSAELSELWAQCNGEADTVTLIRFARLMLLCCDDALCAMAEAHFDREHKHTAPVPKHRHMAYLEADL